MINLITNKNLFFTKPKCNCGLIKTNHKQYKKNNKSRKTRKTRRKGKLGKLDEKTQKNKLR